ncbi:MAG: hypothetical protein HDS68_03380 [Bacteroidales bacterium]|nr:hypothetical protein [Bacteroidales bacterium]
MAEKLYRHIAPLLLLFVASAITEGCSHIERIRHADKVFHCDVYDIYPDSINLHNGVTLRADGDTALMVRVEGNTIRTIRPETSRDGDDVRFVFSSEYPVLNALVNMERERSIGSSYSFSTPYEIYLNPFAGSQAYGLLKDRERNGYVVPMETRRYSWPVINEDAQWIMAACELFNVKDDRKLLKKIGEVAENVSVETRRVCMSPSNGLITGVPRYMTGTYSLLPEWMNDPAMLMETVSFTTNIAWWWALSSLDRITASMAGKKEQSHLPETAFDSDSLRTTLFREFWNPAQGHFSGMLYGNALGPIQLSASDNLGQAIAIVAGFPLSEMSEMIMGMTSSPATGISLFSPNLSATNSQRTVAEALAQTFWAIAASRCDNMTTYEAAVGSLIYTITNDILSGRHNLPYVNQPLTGVVLRGFYGMTTTFDGLHFNPAVPMGMPGTMKIENLHYRNAQLTVILHGTGNNMVSCMLDGKESEPFFPASEEGAHTLEITLSDGGSDEGCINSAVPRVLAEPPSTIWQTPREATFIPSRATSGASSTFSGNRSAGVRYLFIDGVIIEEMMTSHYELFDSPDVVNVQFCTLTENRWMGFSTAPHIYIPPGKEKIVRLADVVRGGTRIIEDKKLAGQFAESNRNKNPRIKFEIDIPEAESGRYAVDVHYLNGLGIVNSRRRSAVRRLGVDGRIAGVFVFPQLSAADWDNSPDREWQNQTAYTNPLVVNLTPGRHVIELRYYQPTPVYVDPTANTVLADYVRFLKLKD